MIVKTLQRTLRSRIGVAWRDALISVCILTACSLIGYLFYSLRLSEANIISIYILGILLIASITHSWVYGTVSSVCGVLLFNFLYADPIFNFYVYDPQYSITIIVMFGASLVTNYVMTLFRRQLDREKLEIRRLDILLETSLHLQQAKDTDDIFNVALQQLHKIFGYTILLFPLSGNGLLHPKIKSADASSRFSSACPVWDMPALELFRTSGNEKKSEIARTTDGRYAICFKLKSEKTFFAVICMVIEAKGDITGFERNLILAMLDEVALSLEKHHLHLFTERIAREAEAERLRANLLRTISHDLRTPLTSISGNADILLNNGDRIEPDLRRQLYQNIYNDSGWLMNLVENLLFITRIDNGVMSINTEYEVLQEILQESLTCMSRRIKEHAIRLEVPDELLVVKVDARLLMQVIINIVDNAVNYAPAGSDIKIQAVKRGSQAVVEVADTGCGISENDKQKVFEMFYTTNKHSGDSRRGIGLGLPLCLSIVNAHGGTIHIADNAPSGVIVSFSLQLQDVNFEMPQGSLA